MHCLFYEDSCIFQEKRTGKRIGTGVRRNGLWYIGKEDVALALEEGQKRVEEDILLYHCRLGHPSFQSMSKMYSELFKKVDKRMLVCDACELGKHTRSSYRPSGVRSCEPFILIHSDVWGPCPVTSLSGVKWLVTFIDCFTCMTWIYMMKNKSEVIKCFQDFHKMVSTQFAKQVHILHSDNGTEYINKEFVVYLSEQGMLHQTTCPGTPSQNGVAERKNRHLLEVARSLMFQMNVPKFLWSEAVMTAAYLINRMPSRILGMKSPTDLLFGKREFVIPPKVFGCVCFVQDLRPKVGKLDPHAIKCVFVGYGARQKGYKCWDPIGKKLYVSMDVTFREWEPYYKNQEDLAQFWEEISPDDEEVLRREGEKIEGHVGDSEVVGIIPSYGEPKKGSEGEELSEDDNIQEGVVVETIPCPVQIEGQVTASKK